MRLAMTKDGLRMFWQKPVLGWGLGTFTTVYPAVSQFLQTLFVNAAHNDYVQVLAETVLIGFAAVVRFIVEVCRARLRNAQGWSRNYSRALGLAAFVGCTGLLVHVFFDFNLQIPANVCVFYFLCAVSTRTAEQLEVSRRSSRGQADSRAYSANERTSNRQLKRLGWLASPRAGTLGFPGWER
jgi:O-antigen ligase